MAGRALLTPTGTVWISEDKLQLKDSSGTAYSIGIEGEKINNIASSPAKNLIYFSSRDSKTNSWRLGTINLTSGEYKSFESGLSVSTNIDSLSVTPNRELIVNTNQQSSPIHTYDMSSGKAISNQDVTEITKFYTANKKGEVIDPNTKTYKVKSLHYATDGSIYLTGSSSDGKERLFTTANDASGNLAYIAITDELKVGSLQAVLPVSGTNCFFTLDDYTFKNLHEYNVNGGLNKSKNSYQLYSRVEFGNDLFKQSGGVNADKLISFYNYSIESANADGTLTYSKSIKRNNGETFDSVNSLQTSKVLQIQPGSWLNHQISKKTIALETITVDVETLSEEVIFSSFDKDGQELDRLSYQTSSNGDMAVATIENEQYILRAYALSTGEIGLTCINASYDGQLSIIYDDIVPQEYLQQNIISTNSGFRTLSSRMAANRNGSNTELTLNANIYTISDSNLLRLIATSLDTSFSRHYAKSSSSSQELYSFPTYQVLDEYSKLENLELDGSKWVGKFDLPKGSLVLTLPSKRAGKFPFISKGLNDAFKNNNLELTVFAGFQNTYDGYNLDADKKGRALVFSAGGEFLKKFKFGSKAITKKSQDYLDKDGDYIYALFETDPVERKESKENSFGVYGEYNNKVVYDINNNPNLTPFLLGQEGMKAGLKFKFKSLVYGYPDAGLFAGAGVKVGYVGSNKKPTGEQAKALNNLFAVTITDKDGKPVTDKTPETEIYYTMNPLAWVPEPAMAIINTLTDWTDKAYEIYQWVPPQLFVTLLQQSKIPGADAIADSLSSVYEGNSISVNSESFDPFAQRFVEEQLVFLDGIETIYTAENIEWWDQNGMEAELAPEISVEGGLGPIWVKAGANFKGNYNANFTKDEHKINIAIGAEALIELFFGIRLKAEFNFPIYQWDNLPKDDPLAYNSYIADRMDTLQSIIIEPFNTSISGFNSSVITNLKENKLEYEVLLSKLSALVPVSKIESKSRPGNWVGLFNVSTIDGDNQTGLVQDLFLLKGAGGKDNVVWRIDTYKDFAKGFIGTADFSGDDADNALIYYRGITNGAKAYNKTFDATKTASGDFGIISVINSGILKKPTLEPVKYLSANNYLFSSDPTQAPQISSSDFNASLYGLNGAPARYLNEGYSLAGAPNSGLQNGKITFVRNQAIVDRYKSKQKTLDLGKDFSSDQYKEIYYDSDKNTSTRFGSSVSTTGARIKGNYQATSLILNPGGSDEKRPIAFIIDNKELADGFREGYLYGGKAKTQGTKFKGINSAIIENQQRFYAPIQISGLHQLPVDGGLGYVYSAISYVPSPDIQAQEFIDNTTSKSFVQLNRIDTSGNGKDYSTIVDFNNLLRNYGTEQLGISGSIASVKSAESNKSDSLLVGGPGVAFLLPDFDRTFFPKGSTAENSGIMIATPTDIINGTIESFTYESDGFNKYYMGIDKDRNGVINGDELTNGYQITDTEPGAKLEFLTNNDFADISYDINSRTIRNLDGIPISATFESREDQILASDFEYMSFVYPGSNSPLSVHASDNYITLSTDKSDGKGTTFLIRNDSFLFSKIYNRRGTYYLEKDNKANPDKDYTFVNGVDGYKFANSGNASTFIAENGTTYIAVSRLPEKGFNSNNGYLYLLPQKQLDDYLKKKKPSIVDPRYLSSQMDGVLEVSNANSAFGASLNVISDDKGRSYLLAGSPHEPSVQGLTNIASTDQDAYFAEQNGKGSSLRGSDGKGGALILSSIQYKNQHFIAYIIPVVTMVDGIEYSIQELYLASSVNPQNPQLLVSKDSGFNSTFNNLAFKQVGAELTFEVTATSSITQQPFQIEAILNGNKWNAPKVVSNITVPLSVFESRLDTASTGANKNHNITHLYNAKEGKLDIIIEGLEALQNVFNASIQFLDRTAFVGQHYEADEATVDLRKTDQGHMLTVPFSIIENADNEARSRHLDIEIQIKDKADAVIGTSTKELYIESARKELSMKSIGLGARVISTPNNIAGLGGTLVSDQTAAFLQAGTFGGKSTLGLQKYNGKNIDFGGTAPIRQFSFDLGDSSVGEISLSPTSSLICFTVNNILYLATQAQQSGKKGSVILIPYNEAVFDNSSSTIDRSKSIVLTSNSLTGLDSLYFDETSQRLYVGDEGANRVFAIPASSIPSFSRANVKLTDLDKETNVSQIHGPKNSAFGRSIHSAIVGGVQSLLIGAPGDVPSTDSPVTGKASGGSITILKTEIIPSGNRVLNLSTLNDLNQYPGKVTRVSGNSYTVSGDANVTNQMSFGQQLGASIITAHILTSNLQGDKDILIGAPYARYQGAIATPGGVYVLRSNNSFYSKSSWTIGQKDNAAYLGGLDGTILYGQEENGLTGNTLVNLGAFTGNETRDTIAISQPSSQNNLGSVIFYQGNNALKSGTNSAYTSLKPLSSADHAFQVLGSGTLESSTVGAPYENYLGTTVAPIGNYSATTGKKNDVLISVPGLTDKKGINNAINIYGKPYLQPGDIISQADISGGLGEPLFLKGLFLNAGDLNVDGYSDYIIHNQAKKSLDIVYGASEGSISSLEPTNLSTSYAPADAINANQYLPTVSGTVYNIDSYARGIPKDTPQYYLYNKTKDFLRLAASPTIVSTKQREFFGVSNLPSQVNSYYSNATYVISNDGSSLNLVTWDYQNSGVLLFSTKSKPYSIASQLSGGKIKYVKQLTRFSPRVTQNSHQLAGLVAQQSGSNVRLFLERLEFDLDSQLRSDQPSRELVSIDNALLDKTFAFYQTQQLVNGNFDLTLFTKILNGEKSYVRVDRFEIDKSSYTPKDLNNTIRSQYFNEAELRDVPMSAIGSGIGDFDGDGLADYVALSRFDQSGFNYALIYGKKYSEQQRSLAIKPLSNSAPYNIVGIGDYLGSGQSDFIVSPVISPSQAVEDNTSFVIYGDSDYLAADTPRTIGTYGSDVIKLAIPSSNQRYIVNMLQGGDSLLLEKNSSYNTYVNLGSGDDQLTLDGGSEALMQLNNQGATLDGGSGFDRLIILGSSSTKTELPGKSIKDFEYIDITNVAIKLNSALDVPVSQRLYITGALGSSLSLPSEYSKTDFYTVFEGIQYQAYKYNSKQVADLFIATSMDVSGNSGSPPPDGGGGDTEVVQQVGFFESATGSGLWTTPSTGPGKTYMTMYVSTTSAEDEEIGGRKIALANSTREMINASQFFSSNRVRGSLYQGLGASLSKATTKAEFYAIAAKTEGKSVGSNNLKLVEVPKEQFAITAGSISTTQTGSFVQEDRGVWISNFSDQTSVAFSSGIFDLSGAGSPQTVKLFATSVGRNKNTLIPYKVDTLTGAIVNSSGAFVSPGEANYTELALANNLLSRDSLALNFGDTREAAFVEDNAGLIGIALITNGTIDEFLAMNPSNKKGGGPNVYFSIGAANPDGVAHMVSLDAGVIGFEDLWGGGDNDFNDVLLAFKNVPFTA